MEQDGKQQAEYGKRVLEGLSQALTAEFGKGFSYSNLRNFRQFYQTYPDWEKCYTLCSKLTWSHNRLIMRVNDEEARLFYLKEAETQDWSVRNLHRNIQTFYYQRILGHKEEGLVPQVDVEKHDPKDFVKDPYVFEFLNFPEPFSASEKDLEAALLTHLQEFLLELGKGFSFVGRQFRISTETDHFYIDLVFYNYLLKCFVLIDLKTRKLMHQDIGQMDMYRRMFDDLRSLKEIILPLAFYSVRIKVKRL